MVEITNLYQIFITVPALNFIRSTLIHPKEESKALVISSSGRIGGGYQINAISMRKIESLKFHIKLSIDSPTRYEFPIYVEPIVFNGNFLPNPFVIDLVTKYNGDLRLDVKNPAFEAYQNE